MDIHVSLPQDKEEIKRLWQYCFHDTEAYADVFFTNVYKPENTIAAYHDKKVIGAIQFFPKTVCIKGTDYKAAYIGGISVLPEFRNQKIASSLVRHTENLLAQRGIKITFLVPFRFSFYEKLGYKCVSTLSEYSGRLEELRSFTKEASLFPSELPSNADWIKFVNKYALYFHRNEEDIRMYHHLCMHAHCYTLPENAGYLLYDISDNNIFVHEFMAISKEAGKMLLDFLYAHRAQCETFCIRTTADGFLREILCEKTITEKRYPHAMAHTLSDEITLDFNIFNSYINMLGWF